MKNFVKKIIIFKLTWVARGILWRYKPKIIAITGNVVKTSTKDAIYTILKSEGNVRKTEKSFNSEFGIPLTIIGEKSGWGSLFAWLRIIWVGLEKIVVYDKSYPKTLILEVGADKPNDISSVAKWLKPDVVVITRLPEVPVHIEFFPTLESLIEEKISLARHMKKEGTLLVNADDQRIVKAKANMQIFVQAIFKSFLPMKTRLVDLRSKSILTVKVFL